MVSSRSSRSTTSGARGTHTRSTRWGWTWCLRVMRRRRAAVGSLCGSENQLQGACTAKSGTAHAPEDAVLEALLDGAVQSVERLESFSPNRPELDQRNELLERAALDRIVDLAGSRRKGVGRVAEGRDDEEDRGEGQGGTGDELRE